MQLQKSLLVSQPAMKKAAHERLRQLNANEETKQSSNSRFLHVRGSFLLSKRLALSREKLLFLWLFLLGVILLCRFGLDFVAKE
jgi:hypothetical protein